MREHGHAFNISRRNRLSRRQFGSLIATGLSMVAVGDLPALSARAATPKKGGTFRAGFAYGSTTDTLDPGTWNNSLTAQFGRAFFGSCLTEIDEKGAIKPSLAESFEPADRAARWIFKLRKGVTFHNGKPLTADDVVATFGFHMAANSKSAARSLLSGISEVKADGKETVTFALKIPNVDLPYTFSDYHLPIYPAKEGGGIEWEKGIGTGPFILEKFDPGVRVTAKRNPNYYKPDLPYFNEVTLLSILDDAARMNALLNGDVHYIDRLDLKTIDLLKRKPDIEIDSITSTFQHQALMNVTAPPFDGVDVRLAIKWAINREDIVKKILFGYGKAGNDDPIAPGTKYAIQPEPIYTYDPDKAKFHLKKAGFDRLKVDFSVSDAAFNGAVDTAVLMQSHAASAGIDINVVREPQDGYWDNVWMKKPFCMSYWGGRPTCDYAFTTLYTDDAKWNDTSWKNPRFNELVRDARGEIDETKRQALYAEAQQIIHDDGGLILLHFPNIIAAHAKSIAHGELHTSSDKDGSFLMERWWFA